MTTIICTYCGNECDKRTAEINRRTREGHTEFFCNNSCASLYKHTVDGTRVSQIQKVCARRGCGNTFSTLSGKEQRNYCCPSCACIRKHSPQEIEFRRSNRGNENGDVLGIDDIARGLRKREFPRYVDVAAFLTSQHVAHMFEYIIEDYIYDLCILDYGIIFEFDEAYHVGRHQRVIDALKESTALTHGYRVSRISVTGYIIPVQALLPHLFKFKS
jgi:ribosomal protein L24E